MAFTRKMLKALGLNEDQIESVMDEHVSVVEGLKAYKADADKLADTQARLDQTEKELDELKKVGGDAAKVQADFDAYKAKVEAREKAARREPAIREAIKAAGIERESYANMVFKGLRLDDYETGDDGKLTQASADKLKQLLAGDDYKDFRGTAERKGTTKVDPPDGGGTQKTRDEILKIKDAGERQRAIAENIGLFKPELANE